MYYSKHVSHAEERYLYTWRKHPGQQRHQGYQQGYQNETYENYTTTTYQETRQTEGYFPRIQPPEPVRSVTPTENMYRERGNWRPYNHNLYLERDSRPSRRRRSHLDDIYLPNYEDADFSKHANVDFQNRDGNRQRKFNGWSQSSNHNRGVNRKQCFKVVQCQNQRNNPRILNKGNPASNKANTNTNSADKNEINRENNAINSDKDKNSVRVQKRDEDDKNNNCDTKGTNNLSDIISISDNSTDDEDISDNKKVDNENNTRCHDEKPQEKTDYDSKASTSITKSPESTSPIDLNPEKTCTETPASLNVTSSPKLSLNTSPEIKSETLARESDAKLCQSLSILELNQDAPATEIDSDQETVCYDDFITIDNIDTTKSFLEPIDDLMDDYRVVDMEMGTPSPIKRKMKTGSEHVPIKKQKLDDLYAEINSDDLLSQINDVLNEDKQKSETKENASTIKRYRSKSFNTAKEEVPSSPRSKSVDRLHNNRQLDDALNLVSVPLTNGTNLLKILKEVEENEDCAIKSDSNETSNLQESTSKDFEHSDSEELMGRAREDAQKNKASVLVDDSDKNCDVPKPSTSKDGKEDCKKLAENSKEEEKYNTVGDSAEDIVENLERTKKNQTHNTKNISNQNCSTPTQHQHNQKRVEKLAENNTSSKTKIGDEKVKNKEQEPLRKKSVPEEKFKASHKSNVETSRAFKESTNKDKTNGRRSHDNYPPECDVKKRRAEIPAYTLPEKQTKHHPNQKNFKRRPITSGEHKKPVDMSKKFPPPKIDLDVATDENYRIRRTTYSKTNELLIVKMRKLFGNENDAEETSRTANASSNASAKRDDKAMLKTAFSTNTKDKSSDKKREYLPASENDKSKNEKPSSSKSEVNKKIKVIEKVQRRTSVPAGESGPRNPGELRKSVSHNDSLKSREDSTKKDSVSSDKKIIKRPYSRIIDIEEYKKISRNVKTIRKDPREESESHRLNSQSNDNVKNSNKVNAVEKKEKQHGKVASTSSKTSEKTMEHSKKTDLNASTISEINNNTNPWTSSVSKALPPAENPVDLQPKIILQRLDDTCPDEPVNTVRPIAERIRFGLISELMFKRCSMLYQERFPMRQKSRNTTVDDECCDEAIVLANPDVRNDIIAAKQIATPSDTSKEKESDDVIEIKPEIPIIDLTEDEPEVKEETVEVKDDIKESTGDLRLTEDGRKEKEVITLYRSDETLSNSVDVQAMMAMVQAVNPDVLVKENDTSVIKPNEEKSKEQVITIETSTPVARAETNKVVSMSPNRRDSLSLGQANTCSLQQTPQKRSQNIAYSLVENAINEAIKRREKQLTEKSPSKPQSTSNTVRSAGTFSPPNVVIRQTQITQTVRTSGIFIPSEVAGRTANQVATAIGTTVPQVASPASGSTFVKPTVPPNVNILAKKPRSVTQYEVIQSPRRNDAIDHHTLMVVPPSPRRTEDVTNVGSIPQTPRRPEEVDQTPRKSLNIPSQSPRRSDVVEATPIVVPQSPRRVEASNASVGQSPRPIENDQTVAIRSPRRADNAIQNMLVPMSNLSLSPQEVTQIGTILLRYLYFFDTLKKAQLAYNEEIKKVTQYLPALVEKELRTFSDENSTRYYELSKNMVGELRDINLASRAPNTHQAQYIIESSFGTLRGALPSLTLSWVYLMLEALMQPELVHYMAVPYLRAMYNHVGLVTLRIRRSAAGQQQVVDNIPAPDVFTAKQRKLIVWQINQYKAICARQIQLIAYEQEIQSKIARVRLQFLAQRSNELQQNNACNSPQRYLGREVQPLASMPTNRTTPQRRNSDAASSETLKSLLVSNVPKPRPFYQCAPAAQASQQPLPDSNVTIHSNVLINSFPTASQTSDNTASGRNNRKTSELEDQFRIRLPYTLPYDMVPSSSTTTTSHIANPNVSILRSPAVQRVVQNSPAHSFTPTLPEGVSRAKIPTLTPLPPSPVYAPIIPVCRASNSVSPAPDSSTATPSIEERLVSNSVSPAAIEQVSSSSNATPSIEKCLVSNSVSPAAIEQASSSSNATPAMEEADEYEPKPSTSGNGKIVESSVMVKDEDENKELDKDVETIDLTWMDDIDPQQLQSEVEFIAVKKEEPVDEEEVEEEVGEGQVEEQIEEQDPSVVTPSPADSGIASPSQIEYNEQVFSDRTCICGKTAEYVCGCRMAMYCSEPCQLRDWQAHKDICLKYNAKNGIKDGTPNQSDEEKVDKQA